MSDTDLVEFVAELRATGRALAEFIESRPLELRASALQVVSGMAEGLERQGEAAQSAPYRIIRAALEAVGTRTPEAAPEKPKPGHLRVVGKEE
jgi:hypothetical protein